jgi:hypothetical protein
MSLRCWLSGLATFAIATHPAHLVVAAACVLTGAILSRRWGPPLRVAAPLAAAVVLLVATNVVGNGRVAVSPFGSVFVLARLGADGLVELTLQKHCPAAGWQLCAWIGHLPADSDEFMWKPDGPVYGTPGGPIALAPEAAEIVAATLAEHPVAATLGAFRHTMEQLTMVDVGDTLGAKVLDATVGLRLEQYFPVAEQARYADARQVRGELGPPPRWLTSLHRVVLIAGATGTLAVGAFGAWLRDRRLAALVAFVLAGALANAFATGALSGPHDRYQARAAWLLLLPPAIVGAWVARQAQAERAAQATRAAQAAARAAQATRARTVSGDKRTSAS